MRPASYSTSVYSPPYSSFKSPSFSKLSSPSHRPSISLFPFGSPTSRASSTLKESSSLKDFRNTSYSKEFHNRRQSSFSSITNDGIQTTQMKSASFSSDSNPSGISYDRYDSPSTSRFSPSVSKSRNIRSHSVQKQTSLNQEGLNKEDSSRFTSNQKWSAKDRTMMSRSKSVEPASRRYPETSSLVSNNSDFTYYSEKRSNSIQYSYNENKEPNVTSKSPFFCSSSTCSSPCDTSFTRKDFRIREELNVEAINQQEFFQRLSRAHNIVDELLKARGIKFEEEPKFHRRWEPVEMIQEEIVPSPVRRSSSASDSGLSLDNESDGSSNSELVTSLSAPFSVESEKCEKTFVRSAQNEYVLIVRLWTLCLKGAFTAIAAVKKPPDKSIKIKKFSAVTPVEKAISGQQVHVQKRLKKEKKSDKANLIKKVTAPEAQMREKSVNNELQQPKTVTSHSLPCKNEKKFSNQRLTLARYFRRKNTFGGSSAEISIQHVSFYQVAQSLIERHKPVEKSVRIHLRLTERAPTSSQVATVLFIKTRIIHVSSDIISIAKKNPYREDPRFLKLRKTIPPYARKQETVNPVRIPENFMKMLNPTIRKSKEKPLEPDNEIRIARGNLRRVPFSRTVNGAGLAVYMVRDKRYDFPTRDHPRELFMINVLRNDVAKNNELKKREQLKKPIAKVNTTVKNQDPNYNATKKSEIDQVLKKGSDQKNSKGSRRRVVTPAGELGVFRVETSAITTNSDNSCQAENRERSVIAKNHVVCKFSQPCVSSSNSQLIKNTKNDLVLSCTPNLSKQVLDNGNKADSENLSSKHHKLMNNSSTKSLPTKTSFENKTSASQRPVVLAALIFPPVSVTKKLSFLSTFDIHSPVNVKFRNVKSKGSKIELNKTTRNPSTPSDDNSRSNDGEVEDYEENGEKKQSRDDDWEKETKSRVPQNSEKTENLTEAEKAMLAARKRQEKDQAAKLLDYKEYRRVEREKEEEELRALKEKQERRRLEREREEKEFAIKQQQEEQRRRQEEEERKARIEADRKKKEDEKKKRALLSQATFKVVTGGQTGGRNFVIPTKTDRAGKFGNIVQAKQEMGMTKEQQEEAKRNYLTAVSRSIDIPADDVASLKEKIRILHQKICRLEADKYDLEKRQERQEYDLRELNERQRQAARNKALKKGIDPADSASSKYPPKVSIISKYDRQSDRRNFSERRAVFENKKAYPCFPNVPPPPTVYQQVILKLDNDNDEEDPDDYEDEEE